MVVPCGKFDSTNQKHYPLWVVNCHQYGISALVSQMSFGRETSGSIVKCRLFSQAVGWYIMHPSYETKQFSSNLFQDRPGLRAASTDIVVLQDRNVYDTNPAMTCLICNRGCIILIWIRIFWIITIHLNLKLMTLLTCNSANESLVISVMVLKKNYLYWINLIFLPGVVKAIN